MFKNNILYILITIIFCFSQIVEVNEKLWKSRSQENIFTAMLAYNKDIIVQTKDMVVIRISNQNAGEKNRSIMRENIKKSLINATMAVVLGELMLKAGSWFKRWAVTKLSKSFENWRDSLYH
ncbi:hypothetical protein [Bartonella jaculi]|uniref:Uncharacterized protein n=1 Tax=Bartonella jaculi TaxID=686226 RepID=A0ABP9N4C3_9HYPH